MGNGKRYTTVRTDETNCMDSVRMFGLVSLTGTDPSQRTREKKRARSLVFVSYQTYTLHM
jgi:hypothetical protein